MSSVKKYLELREGSRRKILQSGICTSPGAAWILLSAGVHADAVNNYLTSPESNFKPRSLDIQPYYAILHPDHTGLSAAARERIASVCDRHYNTQLPAYVNLTRSFDPWDYQLCGCPTENHLFNDTSCRLAESVVFPQRIFSDGHTAAEYRPYWEDAFRRFVAARARHGFREWRSPIYCHVLFDDAAMIYYLMPPGPTKEAARAMLDMLLLSIGVALRGTIWTGPHSRVYNQIDSKTFSVCHFHQCYGGYAAILNGRHIPDGILAGDYIPPEAVMRLPSRQDRYVSMEKVAPRFYPRGAGGERFNPGNVNVYICRSDREDWGGDGILYNYLSPRFALGSVQDWGPYDGEWHMHCLPWTLMLKCDDNRDVVLSFAGSEAESNHQGGWMTWPNQDNDQDATIFQHRKTLFCQMRAWHQEKIYEVLWGGFPEAPWAEASGHKRLIGHLEEKILFVSRFFISASMDPVVVEGGWLMAAKNGVYCAMRSVRGAFHEEAQSKPIDGRIYLCDVWDDVILVETAEEEEVGSFEKFKAAILNAPLHFDEQRVYFTNLEGDQLEFCWKEEGNPTVNGQIPDYGGKRFNDPCVQAELDSGVIKIACDGAETVVHAADPHAIRREERVL